MVSGKQWRSGLLSISLIAPGIIFAQQQNRPELPSAAAVRVDFERDIYPILNRYCTGCHGAALQKNGLRLDNSAAALTGGYRGPALKPGDSAGSLLVQIVAGQVSGLIMPPAGGTLSAAQIGLLRAWIDQGASWPAAPETRAAAPKTSTQHWSFVAPKRPPIPRVRNAGWVKNALDEFVLARLEREGVEPSPQADRRTLLRRIYLDLIGLPPTPQDVTDFVNDWRSDAYERVVDRLLGSAHFGEKWARHWLDLARYADSDGYDSDQLRPYAWRYREWVVNAYNRDMPFDQFTIQQIAGDLIPNATVEQKIATGFHRNTLSNREGGADLEEYRVEQIVDRVSAMGVTWLALGLGCARCHDHKYDPITQREFYQFYAFFNSADEINIEAPVPGELATVLRKRPEYDAKRKELLAPVAAEIERMQEVWEKKLLYAESHPTEDHFWDRAWEVLGLIWGGNLGWGQLEGLSIVKLDPAKRTQRQRDRLQDYFLKQGSLVDKEGFKELKLAELSKKLDELEKDYPPVSEAPIIMESPVQRNSYIHLRGNFRSLGIEVHRATPAALHAMPADPQPSRLTLARWLVAPENPLTARVQVNRLWQELFGRGLVFTSEDFGRQGAKPTHPELLDWLAMEFQSQGWSQKRMIKLIVMSSTYQQSSNTRPELAQRDPNNDLLARQGRLRLPAELIRDVTLAVSGLLCNDVGGPSVRPPQPSKVSDEGYSNKWVESQGRDRYRRGVYTWIQRTTPFAQSIIFDAADSSRACSRRERSNTPLQSLTLLDDPVFFEAAQALALRLLRERPSSVEQRIDFAFQLCLGRAPRAAEKDRLIRYYHQQKDLFASEASSPGAIANFSVEGFSPLDVSAWAATSSVMLNFDPFITRE